MLRQLCLEEVELHNSEQDCWVVLGAVGDKRVYDLTAFLEDHPGGPELLLDLAGQDVHDEFEVSCIPECCVELCFVDATCRSVVLINVSSAWLPDCSCFHRTSVTRRPRARC